MAYYCKVKSHLPENFNSAIKVILNSQYIPNFLVQLLVT